MLATDADTKKKLVLKYFSKTRCRRSSRKAESNNFEASTSSQCNPIVLAITSPVANQTALSERPISGLNPRDGSNNDLSPTSAVTRFKCKNIALLVTEESYLNLKEESYCDINSIKALFKSLRSLMDSNGDTMSNDKLDPVVIQTPLEEPTAQDSYLKPAAVTDSVIRPTHCIAGGPSGHDHEFKRPRDPIIIPTYKVKKISRVRRPSITDGEPSGYDGDVEPPKNISTTSKYKIKRTPYQGQTSTAQAYNTPQRANDVARSATERPIPNRMIIRSRFRPSLPSAGESSATPETSHNRPSRGGLCGATMQRARPSLVTRRFRKY